MLHSILRLLYIMLLATIISTCLLIVGLGQAAIATDYRSKADKYGFKLIDITFTQEDETLVEGILPAYRINRNLIPDAKLLKVAVNNMRSNNSAGVEVSTIYTMYFIRNYEDLQTEYKFLHVIGASGAVFNTNRKWGRTSVNNLITTEFKYLTDCDGNNEDLTKLYGGISHDGWGNIAAVSLVADEVRAKPKLLLGNNVGASDKGVVLDGFFYKQGKNYKVQFHLYNTMENEKKAVALMKFRDHEIGIRHRSDREKGHQKTIVNQKIEFGKFVGITIGCILLAVVIIAVIAYFVRRR